MNKNSQAELADYAHIRFLSGQECHFTSTSGGFLKMTLGEDEYTSVAIYRAFPHSLGDRYLSVRDANNKEIGIISDLADFANEQVELIKGELERRYFTPIIKSVHKLKEEFGYIYWEVETDRGPRRFTTKNSHECILPLSQQRLIITDVDGNRFDVPNYRALDAKSVKQLETLM